MSMPRAVRHINEIRILDALFRKGPMSRADLGRELGLMRSTAGNLVAGLAREGLIAEGRDEPRDRVLRTGRPGTYVSLNAGHSIFLGADIGVGRITVVALDLDAAVTAREVSAFDADRSDPASVADGVATAIRRVSGGLPDATAIRGLNVAVAGLLDRDGTVMRAPMLGWSKVPLIAMLRDRLPALPVIVAENDANAFAMAELHRPGSAVGRDALFVFLDAGVGGGLVHDGHLVRGHRGYAGEIGHIYVGDHGFAPARTSPGSFESFVGRDAVLMRHRVHGGRSESLADLLDALERGEESARTTLREWARYLGRGLATLTAIFDPGTIVLGGPVASLFGFVAEEAAAALRANLLENHPVPDLRLSTLGVDAPAIGAASMLHRSMLSFDTDLVFNGVDREGGPVQGSLRPARPVEAP